MYLIMHNNKYLKNILKKLIHLLPTAFWVLLIFGFDAPYIAIMTLISATIHELSHIAAIIMLNRSFHFGGVFSGLRLRSSRHLSYTDEILIASAGPAANFAVFLSTLPYLSLKGYVAQFGIISLLTGASNMLPIEGYDGYRILDCIIMRLGFKEGFSRILRGISFLLVCSMTFLALYFMKRLDGGYWIFFVFLSILIKTVKKEQNLSFVRKREKKRDFERIQEFLL